MDYIISYDKSSDRLIGVLFFLLVVSLIVNEFTFILIKTDVNGIHDSLKFIGANYILFIVNTINQLVTLLFYIALAAALLLGLRFLNNTLAHFISFGIGATGLTVMVAAAGSLSIFNITREYLISTGVETDIIAMNGLTIAELRENAFLIAFSLEGASIILFGIYNAVTKSISSIASFTSIILGLVLVIFEWFMYGTFSFRIIRYGIIANYLFIGILYYRKSIKNN